MQTGFNFTSNGISMVFGCTDDLVFVSNTKGSVSIRINPLSKHAEHVGEYIENCRRTMSKGKMYDFLSGLLISLMREGKEEFAVVRKMIDEINLVIKRVEQMTTLENETGVSFDGIDQ
jgi:hypothetical protein